MRYRVEQLSAATGVSVDTIRYYQSLGLLDPPEREGRVAWYDAEHADRIREVRQLQAKGLTLAAIKRVLRGELHFRDLPESHEVVVVALREDQVAEILGCRVAGVGAQGKLALRGLEAAGRDLHVLTPQRILDVGDGETARGELLRVDPDAHREPMAAVGEMGQQRGVLLGAVDVGIVRVAGFVQARDRDLDRVGCVVVDDGHDLRREAVGPREPFGVDEL